MAEINTIKELHSLAKTNKIMLDAINECCGCCTDPIVKDVLLNTKEQIELIKSSTPKSVWDKLTPDELVIILLLSFIKEKEMNQSYNLFDIDILNEAGNWLKEFKRNIY